MSKRFKVIGVISDTHFGSAFAPAPAEFTFTNNTSTTPRKVYSDSLQEYLYTNLLKLGATWRKRYGSLDRLIVNGDMIQGTANYNPNEEVTVQSDFEQTQMAKQALGECFDYKKVSFVTGTPAHVRGKEQYESVLGMVVGAEKDQLGRYATPMLNIRFNEGSNEVMNFAHHVSVAGRLWTQAGGPEREIVEFVAAQNGTNLRFKLLGRAHRHLPIILTEHGVTIIVTPAWQAPISEYVLKNNRSALYDFKVGGYAIEYNEDGIQAIREDIWQLNLEDWISTRA